MKRFTLKIKGNETPVTINFLAQRKYAELVGLKYVHEVMDSLHVEVDPETKKPLTSFEVLNNFAMLIHCGIAEDCRLNGTTTELTVDDVCEILDNIEESKKMMEGVFGTLPVADEDAGDDEGNQSSPVNPG
jgi:hypothetical protein